MTIRDDKIVHEILVNGGITLDIKTNKKINLQYGYMVAIEGCELKVNVKDFNKSVLDSYIEKHLNLLTSKAKYFLGAWVHEGIVYLDISKHSSNLTSAKWLGNLEKQLAIWDLKNSCEITL